MTRAVEATEGSRDDRGLWRGQRAKERIYIVKVAECRRDIGL
jgi:hypothetical protein